MKTRAFTIVEVVAALGLLAVLVGLMTSTLSSMTHRSAWVHERAQLEQGTSVAIDRVATALRTAMVEAPGAGAGVRGDAHTLAILSRATAPPGTTPSDLARVELRCDPQDRTLSGVWSDAGAGTGPETHALAQGVLARFRFHDGRAWRDTFNSSEAGRLPRAVEFAVWFGVPEPDPEDTTGADATVSFPDREPDRLRVIAVPDPAGGASP